LSPALTSSADPDLPVPPESEAREDPSFEQEVVEGPPSKKRRLAPTSISTEPKRTEALPIPTEGDRFLRRLPEYSLEADDSPAFLGAALGLDELINPDKVEDEVDVDQDEFSWIGKRPPGRRIQVSAAMKRLFRSHCVDRITGEEEPPLPVFGESDDESVDSQTWREYEEEEQERLANAARDEAAKERLLSKDQVEEVIRNTIQELESQWLVEKKPKCDRKACRIWQNARRNPNRLALINSTKAFSKQIDTRIVRITAEILKNEWPVGEDVQRKVSGHLEMSVFEKRYQAWLLGVLESPRQPPKPSTLPKPKPKPVNTQVLDDGEELLSSDSDHIEDFIDYDDTVVPSFDDEMEIDLDLPLGEAVAPTSPAPDDSATPCDEAHNGLPSARSTPSSEEGDNCLPPIRPTPKKIKSEDKPPPETPHRILTSGPEIIEIESSPSPVKRLFETPGLDSLESLERIGEIGIEHWETMNDAKRLVVAALCGWSSARIAKIAEAVKNCDHNEAWDKYMCPIIEHPELATRGSVEFDLARLFDVFVSTTAKRLHMPALRVVTCHRMKREGPLFRNFWAHLKRLLSIFLPGAATSQTPTRIIVKTPSKEKPFKEPISETRDPVEDPSSSNSDASSTEDMPPSTKRRRQRKRRDKGARDLRVSNLQLNEELARRSRQLREKLAASGSVPGDKTRLIVNETKESDEQGLIYVNDRIGSRIKDHQIEGVRFMWNQVVVDSKVRQGCLLAHTMGLGKTMQVITLLVVIAEASASPDESVRLQIPERLRQSKTMILCPPSLVENWFEEIMIWADEDLLGPVRKMDATLQNRERAQTIRDWASSGGVLIIGYSMFTLLVRADDETAKLLLKAPNLVIGDEAHMMKNPDSQRHQATANFKTMNRIAMTGSPLTNNVMDYYAMINWVAPNYLGDIAEFRERFGNPIKEGLYADSEPHQKSKARKRLQVLKKTVDPKVHRKDIQVLLNELPQKKEFIITLPLTKLQMQLYETYIDWTANPSVKELVTGQARVWSLVAKLGLVLAHPIIFKTVAEAQKGKPGNSNSGALQSSKSVKAVKSGEGDDDNIELPQDVLIKLLATVAVREIEDYTLSNKILVLLRILDECRKVGDKVLVFSQSIPTLDYLENIFKRQRVAYQRLDGRTPMSERQTSVKKFNTDSNSEVYLISTRAGGVGLNIYGANRVVIFDFKYTPADEQQAIGRAYRLGQTKPVYVYWLTAGGTFEDTIHNNAIFKTQLASRVVDKKNPNPWSKRFGEYFVMPKIPDQEDLSKAFGQDRVLDVLLKSDDIGKLVRKITSTETFEKEETYEFSPEDQREVEQELELEQLRISNPEEYRRREHQRVWQSRTELGMPPPPLGHQLPPFANGEFPAALPCTGNQSIRTVKIMVPEHLRDKRDPRPPAPIVDGTVPVIGRAQDTLLSRPQQNNQPPQELTLTPKSALVSPPTQSPFPFPFPLPHAASSTVPVPTQTPAGQSNATIGTSITSPKQSKSNEATTPETSPNLQPILGAGTHYKVPPAPSPSTPQNGPSIAGAPTTPSFIAAPNPNFDLTNLTILHKRLSQAGQRVRYNPSDLINKVEEVLVERKTERLPLMDKLQNLQKCSRDPRFAEALLAGHVEPGQLASMTRPEMEKMAASLSGMAEADFKQLVWTAKADLSVCNKTHST
jgi:SNF2 family DNA or RNA helicase